MGLALSLSLSLSLSLFLSVMQRSAVSCRRSQRPDGRVGSPAGLDWTELDRIEWDRIGLSWFALDEESKRQVSEIARLSGDLKQADNP